MAFGKWPFGLVFSVRHGLLQKQILFQTMQKRMNKIHPLLVGLNQRLCLPKTELRTKKETGQLVLIGVLVSFLVFN